MEECYNVFVFGSLKYSVTLHLIFIAALGLLVYSNTFESPFVFDDESFIRENPLITDLKYFKDASSLEEFDYGNLRNPLTMGVFKRRFISFLTFALNYRVNGLDVTGYHIVDITIHILNAFLLYLLVILTFRTPRMAGSSLRGICRPVALISALIFVSHPIQTQAVTYISQRFVLLATCFYLLSLTAYIRSRLSTNRAAQYLLYSLSFIFASTGMMTKEITFTLPVVIVLYEFVFFEGSAIKRILSVFPFMLTMLIIPYMLLSERPDIDLAFRSSTSSYPRWEYLLTQFTVIATYLRLLFVPINQNLDYEYPFYSSFFTPPVLLSFLLLLSIFCLACWFYLRTRNKDGALSLIPFGIFWFFITVSVESSVVPTANLIFEHRVYLPSVGVFLALSIAIFILLIKTKNRKTRAATVFFLILIPLVFSYAAYARNNTWQSRISLWEDVVRKSPRNAVGHFNLALAYGSEGLTDKAVRHFRIASRLKPDNPDPHYNIGIVYYNKGIIEKAIEHYQIALRLKPDFVEAHTNLGLAFFNKGMTDKAIKHFQSALKLKPDFVEAHNNLGNAYKTRGWIDKAIEHYRIALKLKPDDAETHFNLGLGYLEKGFLNKARREFEMALRINPGYRQARRILNNMVKSKEAEKP